MPPEASNSHNYEEGKDGKIPFLDMLDILIVRKDDETEKVLVYRKSAHRDHYLFDLHHPFQHKFSVIRILLDRCF